MSNDIIYILLLFILFFKNIQNTLAENSFYLISIKWNSEFEEYDKVNKDIQKKIEIDINDTMNEIYQIIFENKQLYGNDEKLEELSVISNLKKRSNLNNKILFINNNRMLKLKSSQTLNSFNDDEVELIPFESKLLIHICPVLDYYVIIAYLPQEIVKRVENLPNIIRCTKSMKIKNHSTDYYDKEKILQETKWTDLSVQEAEFDFKLRNSALSIMSQGKYFLNSSHPYDNNYYYPTSAGKGIDIYIIDDGLDISLSEENFDTYENTPDERSITCDGIFYDGQIHKTNETRKCFIEINGKDDYYGHFNHGTAVAISALGTLNGVAKKANLHSLAIEYYSYDVLTALDYVKQHGKSNRSVINISSGVYVDEVDFSLKEIQDKINELVDYGIVIVASAGNSSKNCCKGRTGYVDRIYGVTEGVIKVGAINNQKIKEYGNMEEVYEIASYSNFGECVDLFAPGTIKITDKENDIIFTASGTSFSSPFVAGLAATIMAENHNIKYDYESIKKKLIELSIKDVIKGIDDETPNRLANNGKFSIFGPSRCNDISNENHCGNQCCTKYGICVNSEDHRTASLCLIENGCESEFGFCINKNSSKKCNINNKCSENECCSKDGNCVESDDKLCLIENGCQTEFGNCSTKKCGKEFNNRKCEKDECCSKEGNCVDIYDDESGFCFLENGCLMEFSHQCLSENPSKISLYDIDYQNIIKEYLCHKEITEISKYCSLQNVILERDYYNIIKRNKICNDFKNHKCKDIVNSPEKHFPICKNYDMMYFTEELINDIKYNNIYCSKKDTTNNNDYCISNSNKMDAIYGNLSEVIMNDLCPHDECLESYLSMVLLDFEEINSSYESDTINKEKLLRTIEIYKKSIELMLSKQCDKLAEFKIYSV